MVRHSHADDIVHLTGIHTVMGETTRPSRFANSSSGRPSRARHSRVRATSRSLRPHPLRGYCGARYCLAIRPGLNGPKSTAHEYLSFPCRLSPSNGRSLVLYSWEPYPTAAFRAEVLLDQRPRVCTGFVPYSNCSELLSRTPAERWNTTLPKAKSSYR